MALTLSINTDDSLEIEDCLDIVDKQLDRDDFDSLIESAALLKKLANNRRLLVEAVNDQLQSCTPQQAHAVGDTSFFLGSRERICIRANVWIPPTEMPTSRKWQANILAYLTPHDHNFSFVTVGYFGSGYQTTIFEYDRDRVSGYAGEPVTLRFLERTTLEKGKVMAYRAFKDVHYQGHPSDFSISLNLLVFPPGNRDQYTFDLKNSVIAGRANDYRTAQAVVCNIAGHIGDHRTSTVLEEVARRSQYGEVRLSAYEAWTAIEQSRTSDIWALAVSDPSETVRQRATMELSRRP